MYVLSLATAIALQVVVQGVFLEMLFMEPMKEEEGKEVLGVGKMGENIVDCISDVSGGLKI